MGSLRHARTYDRDVPRDGLRAATPRVTECPYESWGSRPTRAARKAGHRAKGHRWSREIHRVGTRNAHRPKECVCQPHERDVTTGKRSAVISRMLRLGRGRRKRAVRGTSPAAYSTSRGVRCRQTRQTSRLPYNPQYTRPQATSQNHRCWRGNDVSCYPG